MSKSHGVTKPALQTGGRWWTNSILDELTWFFSRRSPRSTDNARQWLRIAWNEDGSPCEAQILGRGKWYKLSLEKIDSIKSLWTFMRVKAPR